MKKFSIFLLGAFAVAATSCEDAPEPATPQSNPTMPVFTTGDVAAAPVSIITSGETIALESIRNQEYTAVMNVTEMKNIPADAVVTFGFQLASTPDFANYTEVTATTDEDGKAYVETFAWNEAHLALFGKSPKAKTVYYRIPGYITLDNTNYRIGGPDKYYGNGQFNETCFDMGFVIENAYYLLGNSTTWDLTDANMADYAFTHNSDADVYDDPVFTIKFEVTQDVLDANGGGCYWKIAPQSSIDNNTWDGVWGPKVDGSTDLEGTLIDSNPGAGKIEEPGIYKLTANFETGAYTLVLFSHPEYLCTPGGTNGWSQPASQWLQYHETKGFYGVCPLESAQGFKMTDGASWDDDKTWGVGATAGTLEQPGGNIIAPADGLYWVQTDVDLTSYTLIPVTSVGAIGSFAASGWATEIPFTSNADGTEWSGEVTLAGGNVFKIRINGNWDYNYGGDINQPTLDGADILATEAGTFDMKITFGAGFPKITMTKK